MSKSSGLLVSLVILGWCALANAPISLADSRPVRVPVFEQGSGVILGLKPSYMYARRSVCGACISGRDGWGGIRWTSWGGLKARGSAAYYWNPPAQSGDLRAYRSRLMLSGLRSCGAFRIYTRITGTFTGKRPPGIGRKIKMKAFSYPC